MVFQICFVNLLFVTVFGGFCQESQSLNDTFPIISGALWEYTEDWDCAGNNLTSLSEAFSDVGRLECAKECLANADCLSFVIVDSNCHLKHTWQNSRALDKSCGSASTGQMFTLLDRESCTASSCEESEELHPFPTIAGAKWEFTAEWDCAGNDLAWNDVDYWGRIGTDEERRYCAEQCLALEDCESFNYANRPEKYRCYLKTNYQNSNVLGKSCGSATSSWQFYTLLCKKPTKSPTSAPTMEPTSPTTAPSKKPTVPPSQFPTMSPSLNPTTSPTTAPTFRATYHHSTVVHIGGGVQATLEEIALLLVIVCLCGVVFLLLRWNRRYMQQSKEVHEEVDKVIQMVNTLYDESDKVKINATLYHSGGKVLQTAEPFPLGEENVRTESSEISDKNGNVLIALGKLSSEFPNGHDELFHSEGNLGVGRQESAV